MMAKKKPLTPEDFITAYMQEVLEKGKPKSIYSFTKDLKTEESEFYKYFGNFEALENEIFKSFFDKSLTLLNKSDDYLQFDARNKLLSFYFTFFEHLNANRSFVLTLLENNKNSLNNLKKFSSLRKSFQGFIDHLDLEKIDFKNKNFDNFQNKSMREAAWVQLLLTFKFWLEDQSPNFEKTDIFIEKSVNATFDLLSVKPIQSILDLGKFLVKEKIYHS